MELPEQRRPDREEREERGDDMPAVAEEKTDEIVQFGGRIPSSLRRRARMCAASQDIDAQTLLRKALEEYVTKHGF